MWSLKEIFLALRFHCHFVCAISLTCLIFFFFSLLLFVLILCSSHRWCSPKSSPLCNSGLIWHSPALGIWALTTHLFIREANPFPFHGGPDYLIFRLFFNNMWFSCTLNKVNSIHLIALSVDQASKFLNPFFLSRERMWNRRESQGWDAPFKIPVWYLVFQMRQAALFCWLKYLHWG